MLRLQNNVHANIAIAQIENSKSHKLLGIIKIDSKLTFEDHINHMCKKASAKLNVLSRTSLLHRSSKTVASCQCFFYTSV